MDLDLLYSLPSVLSTCGWTVPYLASNVGGGDWCCCYLKKNLNAPRPSEHPPVKNANLSHAYTRRAKNQARGHKSKNNICQKGSRE